MEKKIIDINDEMLKAFIEEIRPDDLDVRKNLDMGYSWDGSVAMIYEIRPQWNKPENILHHAFAKIRYYKSRGEWKLYWLRANGKWEAYQPNPVATHLQKLLEEIKDDKYGCFFG
jgi:hypothetical protein